MDKNDEERKVLEDKKRTHRSNLRKYPFEQWVNTSPKRVEDLADFPRSRSKLYIELSFESLSAANTRFFTYSDQHLDSKHLKQKEDIGNLVAAHNSKVLELIAWEHMILEKAESLSFANEVSDIPDTESFSPQNILEFFDSYRSTEGKTTLIIDKEEFMVHNDSTGVNEHNFDRFDLRSKSDGSQRLIASSKSEANITPLRDLLTKAADEYMGQIRAILVSEKEIGDQLKGFKEYIKQLISFIDDDDRLDGTCDWERALEKDGRD